MKRQRNKQQIQTQNENNKKQQLRLKHNNKTQHQKETKSNTIAIATKRTIMTAERTTDNNDKTTTTKT